MNKEIKIGFLRGIGFTFSFIILWAVLMGIMYFVQDSFFRTGPTEISEESNVTAEVLNYSDNGDELSLKGVLKNNSDSSWENVQIEAEFFDKGTFVKECEKTIDGRIGVGASENFEMRCKCCSGDFPVFDSIEIAVKDGWKRD